jgi:hypothetical protein
MLENVMGEPTSQGITLAERTARRWGLKISSTFGDAFQPSESLSSSDFSWVKRWSSTPLGAISGDVMYRSYRKKRERGQWHVAVFEMFVRSD